MLFVTEEGSEGPLIVMLHWLGGSAKTWAGVMEGCSRQGLRCAALDLPGFGRSPRLSALNAAASDVDTTCKAIIATIQALRVHRREPWLLAGHSMGGKFAAIVARAALDGAPALEDLRGLILVSPSPPGPEPMDEAVRRSNVESLGRSTLDAIADRAHAASFVDANTGKLPLLDDVHSRTVDDLLRMDRATFVDWFETGSLEDWAARVGTLALPALILAGTQEPALGPDAQRQHTLPHLPQASLVALEGAGHLSPLERPAELADRIVAFVKGLHIPIGRTAATLAPQAQALIESTLTSPQTRAVLNQRLLDDTLPEPTILPLDELLTLRAAARRIVPGCPFDLASRIHRWLALPSHDGWRHDTLPPDIEAWRVGLHSLAAASLRHHGVPFTALDASCQDELLLHARDGKLGEGLFDALHLTEDADLYTAAQMNAWFGDLHAELTRLYIADPRTMHRIGFTGFADEAGFTHIRLDEPRLNEREEFES